MSAKSFGMPYAVTNPTENLMKQWPLFALGGVISLRPIQVPNATRKARGSFHQQWRRVFATVFLLCFSAPAEPERTSSDLTELPIEALLQLEVTTVSRKSEKLSE